jgi:hypothetical protein
VRWGIHPVVYPEDLYTGKQGDDRRKGAAGPRNFGLFQRQKGAAAVKFARFSACSGPGAG